MSKKKLSIYWFILLICNIALSELSAKTMKMYTFYTPSHEILFYEWFIPSLQDDFELVPKKIDQLCNSGVFMSSGWVETMLFKVSMIIKAIEDNWGEIFVYADVDIQFFRPFKRHILKLIKNKDMLIQRNRPSGEVCAGFIVCRGNKRTLNLWNEVKNRIITNNFKKSDQPTLNDILRDPVYKGVNWEYLPVTYFGAGTLSANSNGYCWNPGDQLEIPKDIIIHHANFTKGIQNKIKQFEFVRAQVNLSH